MRNLNKQRGSQTLEFTMVGLPLVFLLFSIANMCFAMLTLHTMQESVEQAARYVATRGSHCSSGTNSCTATVQQITGWVTAGAPGVSATKMNVSLIPASDTGNTISCSPASTCLSSCPSSCNASRTVVWPTSTNGDNAAGEDVIITADCPVTAPMFMFWYGVSAGAKISSNHFYAYSRQRLMF